LPEISKALAAGLSGRYGSVEVWFPDCALRWNGGLGAVGGGGGRSGRGRGGFIAALRGKFEAFALELEADGLDFGAAQREMALVRF